MWPARMVTCQADKSKTQLLHLLLSLHDASSHLLQCPGLVVC